ncbi:ABC transporter ATP-binding protein [Methanolobus profundi]|uniref:Lipooligosaccharide transport system ATP-binding protein n=1 Tax=Methanolobus profundi TaxID=487685 RepID=A0A1I4R739_9EURY|nr:ABC transporter ATP-binding protein [Methanolobus profundi]SFM47760.1 lipooligosaccharide transport system ATP-binding protein [Methanolobus profundi]
MVPIIVAKDLQKSFKSLLAVNNISFSIDEGEVFGFLGPNGAGKTTTMRMIQCVSPVSGGSLDVLGMDVASRQREIKSQMGVVPQENNLDGDFTVYENLLVYSRYFDIPKDEAERRVEELLDFVHLQEKKDVMTESLSGGMKRRLVLARALINRPRLLILDEPTVGLDPQARHLIWEKLRSLKKQGVTIVLTSHYLDEVEKLCDRLVVMDNGKILVEGSPAGVIEEFIGSNIIEAENNPQLLECLRERDANYEIIGDMVHIYPDNAMELSEYLLMECSLTKISARPATLEDVFLKLTGRSLRE